ncbi:MULTISPECIES: chemotaxis protein CheW [Trichocoleus]|uniref:histidine kinase n=1 Tax=Trichocoleus desertorum GB2-A4 TaxID=2933944 RepID=A0ABV0JBA6_9CYAN|nr:chemotaxis protein CheW [Trichocoleus sp. FACHB-46]MBD1860858.1 chemotaxis protein CheW [Trichocoleus sp. FACHB-46]
MNAKDLDRLIGCFIAEAQEFLQILETNLLAIECNPQAHRRSEAVKELFRAAHSIKGSALMFGFEGLSTAAHGLEDCFAILRDRVDLAQLDSPTITALLQGVDCLKTITNSNFQGKAEFLAELQAIAQIKAQLEARYPKVPDPALLPLHAPANYEVIKAIFEHEILTVLNQLEAELSQARPETIPSAVEVLSKIYYQLSGVAGMLQLPEFGRVADTLEALLSSPELSFEQFQQQGWAIAQNLQTARQQILNGQPITVLPQATAIAVPSHRSEPDNLLHERFEAEPSQSQQPQFSAQLPTPLAESRLDQPTVPILDHIGPETPVFAEAATPIPSPSTDSTSFNSWQRLTIRIEVDRLTELVNLVGELVINRTNLEVQGGQLRSEIKHIRRGMAELHQFGGQLREEYDRLSVADWQTAIAPSGLATSPPNSRRSAPSTFDALELDQYTEFHSRAQSVLETTHTVAQTADKLDALVFTFEQSTEQLRRITEQLQSRVMQLRVVPFSRAVDHLPRALRELCLTHHKEVNLLLVGRDTKIDESLLDALREPLVQLLRNALDHGIELPEARVNAGKPPSGQIEISAFQQGGQTIVTVTDDGKGIDPEAIRQQIVARGLVPAEQVQDLSLAELYDFLFWPGFSTTKDVTNLSGRGVGLDIVRSNLRQARGTVKVDSRPGQGTSFILKLPLMLSIAEALMVRIDHNTVAVPLDAIEEILHIQGDQVQMAGNQPMIRWRGEFIRLVRLQDLLHYHPADSDLPSPDPLTQDLIPILVLSAGEGVVAIAVERLMGQQEIVVKPIPAPLSKPKGVVGSTILGNGQVAVILDIDDLVEQFSYQTSQAIAMSDKGPQILAPVPATQPQILVVDDSYTIRQLLALALTRARYRVAQAKDGQDAIEQLQQGLQCDCIIADIEMPRMDGFELLRSLKFNSQFAHIPVAMLTSRSGAKHRKLAQELGAAHYFTKPYNEAQVLEVLAQLLAASRIAL